jgi:hypothetical protein
MVNPKMDKKYDGIAVTAKPSMGSASKRALEEMKNMQYKEFKDPLKDNLGERRELEKLLNSEDKIKKENLSIIDRLKKAIGRGRGGGGGGGGGMNPIDLERVPGKRPLKMKKGGSVKSSASKRADGIAVKGKTRGKMV